MRNSISAPPAHSNKKRIKKMIERQAKNSLLNLAKWYPVVAVVGPRQSGKTTLIKNTFPNYHYINLEDKNTRDLVLQDTSGFLKSFGGKVIIDEAQNCPDLFSQIQIEADSNNVPGNFIISGSRNLTLHKHIRQSLAGRVGVLTLLPLSYEEILSHNKLIETRKTDEEIIFSGGFPRLIRAQIDAKNYYRNYAKTYVNRDVRIDLRETSLSDYRKLVRICATNAGDLINYSNISKEIGASRQTVKTWMSLLFQSYVCFELPSYHANVRKSLTKTPKLYFYDTGLLCYLLKIYSTEALLKSNYFGKIFENFVIVETMKHYLNNDEDPEIYYYRDDSKREIDLICTADPDCTKIAEIKSTSTFRSDLTRNLNSIGDLLKIDARSRSLIMRSDRNYSINNMNVQNVKGWIEGLG